MISDRWGQPFRECVYRINVESIVITSTVGCWQAWWTSLSRSPASGIPVCDNASWNSTPATEALLRVVNLVLFLVLKCSSKVLSCRGRVCFGSFFLIHSSATISLHWNSFPRTPRRLRLYFMTLLVVIFGPNLDLWK